MEGGVAELYMLLVQEFSKSAMDDVSQGGFYNTIIEYKGKWENLLSLPVLD